MTTPLRCVCYVGMMFSEVIKLDILLHNNKSDLHVKHIFVQIFEQHDNHLFMKILPGERGNIKQNYCLMLQTVTVAIHGASPGQIN